MAYPDWQPIETHPKRPYLELMLCDARTGQVTMGCWIDHMDVWHEAEAFEVTPTHWMPKPDPAKTL